MADEPTDPNDIQVLKRQIAELQAQVNATRLTLAASSVETATTQGGAVVAGSAQAGRDFIGRDSIKIINQVVSSDENAKEVRSVIAHYLQALAKDLSRLRLGEIDVSASDTSREPLQLADVYVPLDTHVHIPADTTLDEWLSRKQHAGSRKPDEQQELQPVSALEALATHRELTLLGKAGSGKSTFGAHVLLTLAQAWQGQSDQLNGLGESWAFGALLPIRIVLRRFAEQLPPGDNPPPAGDLWDFIAKDLYERGYALPANTLNIVQRIAREHGALILFDGLDECGSKAVRQRVFGAVQEFERNASSKCRFLVTARPYARPNGAEPVQGVYTLADLRDELIEGFIRAWYQALVRRAWLAPDEAERKTADLLVARHRTDLLPLAENPLLLTLMATLHANRGRLPDDRADLYDESVDLLMLRWNRQIGADKALLDELAVQGLKLSDLREVLEELAFQVHEESVNNDRDSPGDIGEDRLVRAFCPLLNGSRDKAVLVVDYIEKRAGLLIGQGEKDGEQQFTFPHRTFQEFLAACFLAARQNFPAECGRLAKSSAGHWQVVLPLAARLAKTERGASAADELVHGTTISDYSSKHCIDEEDWACALLAGMQLCEIGVGAVRKHERTNMIANRVAGWITECLSTQPENGGLAAMQRAQAGDVLTTLGDPRFDPQRFYLPGNDMLGFKQINADAKFRIGTAEAQTKHVAQCVGYPPQADEINETATPTTEFYIAQYPVTVAQFRVFVDSTKFKINYEPALHDSANRPVCHLSWHEAIAYCDWLHSELASLDSACQVSSMVRSGQWQVTLPSELEWEKAARGGMRDGIFPWGDTANPERANYNDTGIEGTSAVGCFPANDYTLYDMSGNVFEWTRSVWGSDPGEPEFTYPYDPTDTRREDLLAGDDMLRLVRGGCWDFPSRVARCAFRYGSLPDLRLNDLGFRVMLRCVPVSSAL